MTGNCRHKLFVHLNFKLEKRDGTSEDAVGVDNPIALLHLYQLVVGNAASKI